MGDAPVGVPALAHKVQAPVPRAAELGPEPGEGEDALRALSSTLVQLMGALPPHSVMLAVSDHGHEASGGAGGTTDAARRVPAYAYYKSVGFDADADDFRHRDGSGRGDRGETRSFLVRS